jgi:excisionase family DNA binding protein
MPSAISEMAKQIEDIKSILSEKQPPQVDTSKKKYKLPEAAKYCGMSSPTFRTYIYKRKVASTKFGKSHLFLERDLDKFIQDYRRPTADELKKEAVENLTNGRVK